MRSWLSSTGHRLRLWLARHWADPQLAIMAERYGAVIVTSERHGKVVLPIYRLPFDGEIIAELAQRLRAAEFNRAQVVEECARVCEEFMPIQSAPHLALQRHTLENAALVIRSLKAPR